MSPEDSDLGVDLTSAGMMGTQQCGEGNKHLFDGWLLAQIFRSPVSAARRCNAVPAGTRWALNTAKLFPQSDANFAVSNVAYLPSTLQLEAAGSS